MTEMAILKSHQDRMAAIDREFAEKKRAIDAKYHADMKATDAKFRFSFLVLALMWAIGLSVASLFSIPSESKKGQDQSENARLNYLRGYGKAERMNRQ